MSEFEPEDLLDDYDDGGESPSVRRFYWRAVRWLLVALGIQTFAGLAPGLIETIYSRNIYFYIPRLLAKLTQLVGVPLAEGLLGLIVAVFILWGVWSVLRHLQGRAPIVDSIKVIILYFIWTASIMFIVFKLMWGLNYQRMALADTPWFDSRYAKTEELTDISNRIINGIRSNYGSLPGNNPFNDESRSGEARSGEVSNDQTDLALNRPDGIAQAIELSFRNNRLIENAAAGEVAPPKTIWSSNLSNLLGLRSFYLPFTGEVFYQSDLSPIELPFAIARAKAYQRGYAREDEANFVAFLVCTTSASPVVRYSGYLHGVRVLEELKRSGIIGDYRSAIGEGPQQNLDRLRSGSANMIGGMTRAAFDLLFNFHLQVNRVERGIKSGDGDVDLIIYYYLKNKSQSPFVGGSVEP
jgi:hypothetical protein